MLIETKPEPSPSDEDKAKRGARHRWHAVTIVAPASACPTALSRKGKRYLSSEAPRLPLPECTMANCQCKYRHYDDRRNAPRRADEKGGAPSRVTTNRRTKRGRRSLDV